MFVPHVYSMRMADPSESHASVHIPMVYENVELEPARWEYHVLSADTRETPLPDAQQFNALGKDGWIMVGLLDERATGQGTIVHYYFTRQARN